MILLCKLLGFFDDFDKAPPLVFADGTGFHDFNGIADTAAVIFIVCLKLDRAVIILP